jgi:hypothetical protein
VPAEAHRGRLDAITSVRVQRCAVRKELPSELPAVLPSDEALEYSLSKFRLCRPRRFTVLMGLRQCGDVELSGTVDRPRPTRVSTCCLKIPEIRFPSK